MCADPSLDHLIRPLQERRRDRPAEGLGGLEVDGQFEFRRLLERKISRLGAPQNLVYIDRTAPRHRGDIHPIGHEATLLNKEVDFIDCGDPLLGREIDDFSPMYESKRRRHHQYALIATLHHPAESGSKFPRSVHDEGMKLYAKNPSGSSGLLIVPSAQLGYCRESDVLLQERDP